MESIYQGRTKTTGVNILFAAKRKNQGSCQGNIYQQSKDNGAEEIIRILDEIFQCDETTQAYHEFKDYVEHTQSCGQNLSFVVEYENH